MVVLIIIIALVKLTDVYTTSVGSALFYKRSSEDDCWNDDDIAKLRARRVFEELIPPHTTPDKIDGKYIRDLTHYFRRALKLTENTNAHNATILKDALADTIGGHLRSKILPAVRFAYYAGYISHKRAKQAHEFYNDIKSHLNTLGLGWTQPIGSLPIPSLNVSKVVIKPTGYDDPCSFLVLKRDKDTCIHLPKPRIDDPDEPAAIALPFKNGGLASLSSPKSENIVIQYYTTASKCLLQRSTNSCRHADFVNFNNEIWHWMTSNVAAHLMDEKLYSAYGGIFRVAAAVQGYGRGLKRRNLFDSNMLLTAPHGIGVRSSYSMFRENWTATTYVLVIVMIAITVYVAQVFLTMIFSDSGMGGGKKHQPEQEPKTVAYTDVESNFPAMLPAPVSPTGHSDTEHSEHEPAAQSRTRTSLGSVRTECVYDLNENQEKLMDVIMSAEASSDESVSSSGSEEEANGTLRACSPPQLAAQVMQLRSAQRSPRSNPRRSECCSQNTSCSMDRPAPHLVRSRRDAQHTTSYSDSGSSTSGGSWREREWARRMLDGSRSQPTSEGDLDATTSYSRQ